MNGGYALHVSVTTLPGKPHFQENYTLMMVNLSGMIEVAAAEGGNYRIAEIFVGESLHEFRESEVSREKFLHENGVLLVWSLGFQQFSEKMSVKLYLEAIHENFLPRKIPTIWYFSGV